MNIWLLTSTYAAEIWVIGLALNERYDFKRIIFLKNKKDWSLSTVVTTETIWKLK